MNPILWAATAAEVQALSIENPQGFLVAGLPGAEYHAGPGLSRSDLVRLMKAPAAYRAIRDNAAQAPAKEPNAGMVHGSLVHCLALEPHRFAAEYAIGPDVKTKAAKEWKEFEARNPGVECITPAQHRLASGQAEQVRAFPRMAELLTYEGWPELSVYWRDPRTQLLLKIRPDYAALVGKGDAQSWVIADLKTTIDASPESFAKSAANFGYAYQSAFYTAVLQQATDIPVSEFLFIASESEFPYLTTSYFLSPSWAEAAALRCRRAIDRCAECMEQGYWPGYAEGPIELTPPAWHWKELESA